MGLIGDSISQLFFSVSANAGMVWDYVLYLLVVGATGIEFLRVSDHPQARYILQVLRLDEVVNTGGAANSFVETAMAGGELGPHHLEFQGGELVLVFDEPLPDCPLADLVLEPIPGESRASANPPPPEEG